MKTIAMTYTPSVSQHMLRIGMLMLLAFILTTKVFAQRGTGVISNPGNGNDSWIGGNGKIYTLTGKVGIGTQTPLQMLHVWGAGNRYFRITSEGGTNYSNAVAGIELERIRADGSKSTWDIVNQGAFKIRRNANTLFTILNNDAQLGNETYPMTFYMHGNKVNGTQSGTIVMHSNDGKTMNIDGNTFETDDHLQINAASGKGVQIGAVSSSSAKLSVNAESWQMNLQNNAKKWNIGVSSNNWTVGEGKLVFSSTNSSDDALMVMTEQGRVGIGMTTPNRTLDVAGSARVTVLEITGGADLAEPFEIASESAIEAGTVVAIDANNAGQLKVAERAYDKTVAGIISGAGNIKPGMVMGQEGSIASGEHPVALTGRVYAKVDASYGAIQPGDLLTTSNTPGHAMKVSDTSQAQGAIIGKAMTALEEGTGLVLVLVSLQ